MYAKRYRPAISYRLREKKSVKVKRCPARKLDRKGVTELARLKRSDLRKPSRSKKTWMARFGTYWYIFVASKKPSRVIIFGNTFEVLLEHQQIHDIF